MAAKSVLSIQIVPYIPILCVCEPIATTLRVVVLKLIKVLEGGRRWHRKWRPAIRSTSPTTSALLLPPCATRTLCRAPFAEWRWLLQWKSTRPCPQQLTEVEKSGLKWRRCVLPWVLWGFWGPTSFVIVKSCLEFDSRWKPWIIPESLESDVRFWWLWILEVGHPGITCEQPISCARNAWLHSSEWGALVGG